MRKKHLYFVPGMAASSKIFENLVFPPDSYELHFLEWIKPLYKQETLSNYAMRMCEEVTEKNPVIVGVSFGGIVAQEMSKYIDDVEKVIIISSIKSNDELPKRLKLIKKTNVYKLFPSKIIENSENYKYFFSDAIVKKATVYDKYLSLRSKRYLKWAIDNLLNWEQKTPINNLVHIHGDNDPVFPIKNIKNSVVIKKGTHIMILVKAREISEEIQQILA